MRKSAAPKGHWLSAADWALMGVLIMVAGSVLAFQG
jgi:hypothetical protein